MPWHYGPIGLGWFGWLLMIIVIAVFVGGLAAVVVTIVRKPHTTALLESHGSKSPLDVLADRFARGEIDEEEYRKRRDTLRESPGRPLPRKDP
jgi:putative membrane protein